jgi:hypothetical protein
MKDWMTFARRTSALRPDGFTRVELAAAVFAIALLLAVVVAPALAATATKSDSGRVTCFNNLRLVGRAVQIWTSDHNRQFPWRTHYADGGTSQGAQPRAGNAWFEFAVFSNELVTPKILACPSDTGVKQARIFDFHSDGGFMNVFYRAAALSYSLNVDGSLEVPRSWLTGDRNFRPDYPGGGNCSTRVVSNQGIDAIPPELSLLAWTNAVHGASGHLLTTDGSVEYTFSPRLKEIILQPGIDDGGQIHFLRAR